MAAPEVPQEEQLVPQDTLSIQMQNVLATSRTFTAMNPGLQTAVTEQLRFLTETALSMPDIQWNTLHISQVVEAVIESMNTSRAQEQLEPYSLEAFVEEIAEQAGMAPSKVGQSFDMCITKLWQMVHRDILTVNELESQLLREEKTDRVITGEQRATNPDQHEFTLPPSKEGFILSKRG